MTGDNPFELFLRFYKAEAERTTSKVPGACCLSTIGTDGYPNARFLALKKVTHEGFVVTGPLSSRKGEEIRKCPHVALTFWWPATEKQVRVQGDAVVISAEDADRHFHDRPVESQLLARVSRQGEKLDDPVELADRFEKARKELEGKTVPRPDDWGGYCIVPVRIEFLEFHENRLHERYPTSAAWNIR